MKIFVILLSLFNLYWGAHHLLNLVGLLQNSKYALSTNFVLGTLLVGMSIGGLYFSFVQPNYKIALSIALLPWLIVLLVVFVSLVSSSYR